MRQFGFSLILLLAGPAWGQNIGPGGAAATPGGSTTNPACVNEVGNSYPVGLVPVSDVATSLLQDSFPAGALGTGKWIATNGGGGAWGGGGAGGDGGGGFNAGIAQGGNGTSAPSFTPSLSNANWPAVWSGGNGGQSGAANAAGNGGVGTGGYYPSGGGGGGGAALSTAVGGAGGAGANGAAEICQW